MNEAGAAMEWKERNGRAPRQRGSAMNQQSSFLWKGKWRLMVNGAVVGWKELFLFWVMGCRPSAAQPLHSKSINWFSIAACLPLLVFELKEDEQPTKREWMVDGVGMKLASRATKPITNCPLIQLMKSIDWRAGCSFHFIPLHSTKEKKNKFIFSLLSFRFTCGMKERN